MCNERLYMQLAGIFSRKGRYHVENKNSGGFDGGFDASFGACRLLR